MAFTYENKSAMCRCTRAVKLYRSPSDIRPTMSAILYVNDMFISDRIATVGKLQLRQISAPVDTNKPVPIGYWCPIEALQWNAIENAGPQKEPEIEADDSVSIDEKLFVKSKSVTLYNHKESTSPVENSLKPGDILYVDRKFTFNCNGTIQTRYHIVNSNTEDPILDGWIVAGPGVCTVAEIARQNQARIMKMNQKNGLDAKGFVMEYVDPETQTGEESAEDGETTTTEEYEVGGDVNAGLVDNVVDFVQDMLGITSRMDMNKDTMEELYEAYGIDYNTAGVSESYMSQPIGRLIFVHGMPFQYSYITDRRQYANARYGQVNEATVYKNTTTDVYGRSFAREIAANMPIMVMVPGIPKYMTKASSGILGISGGSNQKLSDLWTNLFNDLTGGEEQGVLQDIVEQMSGRGTFDYYSMEIDMTDYFKYVNATAQTSARLMGLGGQKIRIGRSRVDCTKFNWGDYNTSAAHDYGMFSEVVGLDGGISFAYDPLSSISDSISNSTSESQFSSTINSISSKARELSFLTGQVDISGIPLIGDLASSVGNMDVEAIADSGTNPLSRAMDFLTNTAKGFNIRFPEIWQDSSHSRSYSVDMHFITPYATAFCKWRYVLVPFFHLFNLAAPQAPKNMSIYGRPFLIRAFSKGYFNVELGIIETIEWKRYGDGDMISADGVPTQIDVSITFRDLYHVLTAGKTDGATTIAAFFNNTGLMDMIGVLSGVDINRIGLMERLSLYTGAMTNAIFSLGTNFMSHMQDRARNFIERTWFM